MLLLHHVEQWTELIFNQDTIGVLISLLEQCIEFAEELLVQSRVEIKYHRYDLIIIETGFIF